MIKKIKIKFTNIQATTTNGILIVAREFKDHQVLPNHHLHIGFLAGKVHQALSREGGDKQVPIHF